ncbi:hypothetical protein A9Q93_00630 [Nonlabens dokdonensis]|uniref:Uncharacterized protein n=1 Tax=Nonlabens dokdonensis TaxID=328515 RepID=A0A1Z8BG65_9FLAO|nr:hypothetical protein [Nonlabens dokdonensis]OUS21560.1 hypothetical protein A9Q93_00630 [Nonlabens dokdonensis]
MRIKKKYFPIILLILCFIINACSKEGIENYQTEESQNFISKISANAILDDGRFLSLIEKNDRLLNKNYNLELLNQLVAEENDDVELLGQSLGFETTSEFINFQNEFVQDLNYLQDTYNIKEISEIELVDLIHQTGYYNSQVESDPFCDRERRNCLVQASAAYTLEAVGCSALNLTLFGGVVCYGVITALYLSEVDDCDIQYQRCGAS